MDLYNFLVELHQERFKATAAIDVLSETIKLRAEEQIFEKYKDEIYFNNNMEFKLLGVEVRLDIDQWDISVPDVSVHLAFICKSKLPKAKLKVLAKHIEEYEKYKYFKYDNSHKKPIAERLFYEVPIKSIIDGEINLQINKKVGRSL